MPDHAPFHSPARYLEGKIIMKLIRRSKFLTFLLFTLILASATSALNIMHSDNPEFISNLVRSSLITGFIVFVVLRKRFE